MLLTCVDLVCLIGLFHLNVESVQLMASDFSLSCVEIRRETLCGTVMSNTVILPCVLQNGVTALHSAAIRGYLPVVEVLLKNKAQVNAVDQVL